MVLTAQTQVKDVLGADGFLLGTISARLTCDLTFESESDAIGFHRSYDRKFSGPDSYFMGNNGNGDVFGLTSGIDGNVVGIDVYCDCIYQLGANTDEDLVLDLIKDALTGCLSVESSNITDFVADITLD